MNQAQTIANELETTCSDDHIEPCERAEAEWHQNRHGGAAIYRFKDGSWLYVDGRGGKPETLQVVPLRWPARIGAVAYALIDNDDNVVAVSDDDVANATELTHGWGESTR